MTHDRKDHILGPEEVHKLGADAPLLLQNMWRNWENLQDGTDARALIEIYNDTQTVVQRLPPSTSLPGFCPSRLHHLATLSLGTMLFSAQSSGNLAETTKAYAMDAGALSNISDGFRIKSQMSS